MLKIPQYGFVSKTFEHDLESGIVTVDNLVDIAKENNLVLILRVTEKGFMVGGKQLLAHHGIENIIEKGAKIDIESDYDLLCGNPGSPEDPITSLAEYQANFRKKNKNKISGRAALRVTLGHNILKEREFDDNDYQLIIKKTEAYNRILKRFNAALAWENTYHNIDQMLRILDLTKDLERIGMTFDFGNAAALELHPKGELPSQEQIMKVALQYIGKIYRVHIKQIVDGHMQPVISDYEGAAFKINNFIKELQRLGYNGYFSLEQTSTPCAAQNINASLVHLPRFFSTELSLHFF